MSSKRIHKILDKLKLNRYLKIGSLNNSFIRNRKLNFFDFVICLLFKNGKSLSLELRSFMNKMNHDSITKQAFSKQRLNLNPKLFRVLNNDYLKLLYKERNIFTFKDYIVLAIDGSLFELPNSDELKDHYGLQLGQKGSVGRVRARVLGIYDSLNRIMIDSRIDPYSFSEKKQIEKELKNIKKIFKKKKVILVCDRFYFGISFIHRLDKLGFKYLIRMRNNFYKKEKLTMSSNDEILDLKVRTNSVFYAETEEEKKELKKLKSVKSRIIKVTLSSSEEEHLATNLSFDVLSTSDASELYFGRWEIEKAFDILKNKLNTENFSSKKVIGIEQEFYASTLLFNMIEDLKSDASSSLSHDEKKKYHYKINTNILVGIFKDDFINLFIITDDNERDLAYENFINDVKKHLVPIKPGRSFERKKMHSMNKYRSNLRRNS